MDYDWCGRWGFFNWGWVEFYQPFFVKNNVRSGLVERVSQDINSGGWEIGKSYRILIVVYCVKNLLPDYFYLKLNLFRFLINNFFLLVSWINRNFQFFGGFLVYFWELGDNFWLKIVKIVIFHIFFSEMFFNWVSGFLYLCFFFPWSRNGVIWWYFFVLLEFRGNGWE